MLDVVEPSAILFITNYRGTSKQPAFSAMANCPLPFDYRHFTKPKFPQTTGKKKPDHHQQNNILRSAPLPLYTNR